MTFTLNALKQAVKVFKTHTVTTEKYVIDEREYNKAVYDEVRNDCNFKLKELYSLGYFLLESVDKI